ncbi:MAG: hypothetical protein Q4D81_05685, partial [Eubacteriales bacterium]|nr:hypothetical protein [Eubacteriales bacterium]
MAETCVDRYIADWLLFTPDRGGENIASQCRNAARGGSNTLLSKACRAYAAPRAVKPGFCAKKPR